MKKIIIIIFLVFSALYVFSQDYISKSQLVKRIESIGGLKFKKNVQILYLESKQFKSYLSKYFYRIYYPEEVKKNEIFLNIMGFMSNKIPFIRSLYRMNSNNAGAFYDEDRNKLIVMSKFRKSRDPLNLLILVHELRRMVQENHYSLHMKCNVYSDFDDRKLAVTSASIGDAMLIMSLYAKAYTPFTIEPGVSDSGYYSDSLLTFSPLKFSYNLEGIPEVLKKYRIMPYIYGLRFVFNVLQKKKMKGLLKILSDPPISSEQVLHPKKYLKNEKPDNLEIKYNPEGYSLFHSGVIGEYLLNILLMKRGLYKDSALGWDGDLFKLFISGNNYFLIWKSVWENKKISTNFFHIFRAFLEKKYSLSFRNGNIKGNPFIAGKNADDFFFMRLIDNRLIYIKSSDRSEINKFINGGVYD